MALLLASVFLLVCVDCCSSPVRPGVGVNILNQVTPEAAPASTRLRLIYPLQGHTGRAGPPHSRTTEVLWGLIQCTSASMLHGAHTSRPAHTVSTFLLFAGAHSLSQHSAMPSTSIVNRVHSRSCSAMLCSSLTPICANISSMTLLGRPSVVIVSSPVN